MTQEDTLGDFAEQTTEENGHEYRHSFELFTAGSGDGSWACIVQDTGSFSPEQGAMKQGVISGETKQGFIPQLTAVAEGEQYLDDHHPNAVATILTPSEAIVGLVKGNNEPDDEYRELYRTCNTIFDAHRSHWEIEHIPADMRNPARDIL